MVNGSRYYRALESVSIASSLSSALTIYPCQIRVHQRWQSKLQLLTARQKEWPSGGWSQRTVYPRRLPVNTVIHTTLAGVEPTTFRLLVRVRRATSSVTDSPLVLMNNSIIADHTLNWHWWTVVNHKNTNYIHPLINRLTYLLTY